MWQIRRSRHYTVHRLRSLDAPVMHAAVARRIQRLLQERWLFHLPKMHGRRRDAGYIEADRAMCGLGDLMLTPQYAKHRTTADCWKQMTAGQRQKASDACFRQMPCPSSVSTDGNVQVPMTSCGGKKPHQRKRQLAEKSTTVQKKPRVVTDSDEDFAWVTVAMRSRDCFQACWYIWSYFWVFSLATCAYMMPISVSFLYRLYTHT